MDPRDDPMTDRRSFGSNYHPSSQSRKMSIGVVVDSSPKTKPQKASLHVAREAPQHTAIVTSRGGNLVKDTHRTADGASPHPLENQPEAPGQITSPWVSTRSVYRKVSSSEAIVHAKNVSRFLSSSKVPKPSLTGTKEAAATHSVHFFANQLSILQSASVQQKKINRVADQSMADKESAMGQVCDFAPANEALIPEKAAEGTNVAGNNGNGTLRMKLWEILGTVSSPIKQHSNSQTFEGGANNSQTEVEDKEKASSMIKSKQHSDTIETDSHSSDHTVRRPVTRSLTKKKPQAKVSLKKPKTPPLHLYKHAHLEENILSFEAGWSERLHVASSKSKRETSERKRSRIDPDKMLFPDQKNADQAQGATDRMKRQLPSNSSLYGDSIEKHNSEPVEPTNGLHQVSHHSPVVETVQPGNADEPTLEEHVTQQEQFSNSSPNNIVNSQYDLQSPGFDLKTPIKNSSPSFSSNTNQGEAEDDSPAERAFDMDGTHGLKRILQTKGGCYKANEKMGSSNPVRELEDSPVVKTVPIIKEQRQKNRLSGFPCEEGDPESSMDGWPITSDKETGSAEERNFVLCPAKKYWIQTGHEEIDEVYGSEQNGEDGLASAVTLISFALERVKSKMDSMTRRRAAEILMSVSKIVYLQLQNVESQIETDVRKLAGLNKSKRKRLEIRFQEQQEQLKLIYERFNEEVNQHLQDCKSTLEGLEPQHTEFKGAAEKLKVSHRKLLLEAEEAIETQLDDCQRRITSVHKLARKKMLQLKHAIAECLKGGALS